MFDSCIFNEILFDGTRLVGVAYTRNISEALRCADYILKRASQYRDDTISIRDISSRLLDIKRLMSEYVGVTDYSYSYGTKSITDQIAAADHRYSYNLKYITDITALSDTKLSSVYIPQFDSIFMYDNFGRILELFRTCIDISYLTDYSMSRSSLLKSDSMSLSDYSFKSAFSVIIDDIMTLDIFSRMMSTYRIFDDMTTLLDAYTTLPTKQADEVILLYDGTKVSFLRVIYDIIGTTDNIVKSALHSIDDDVAITDSTYKYLSYIRRDAVYVNDTMFKYTSIFKRDISLMLDLIYKRAGIIIYDMCSTVDSILYTTSPVIISNIIKKVIHLGDIGGLW